MESTILEPVIQQDDVVRLHLAGHRVCCFTGTCDADIDRGPLRDHQWFVAHRLRVSGRWQPATDP